MKTQIIGLNLTVAHGRIVLQLLLACQQWASFGWTPYYLLIRTDDDAAAHPVYMYISCTDKC